MCIKIRDGDVRRRAARYRGLKVRVVSPCVQPSCIEALAATNERLLQSVFETEYSKGLTHLRFNTSLD